MQPTECRTSGRTVLVGHWAGSTQKGHKAQSRVLGIRSIPAPKKIVEALTISVGAPTVLFKLFGLFKRLHTIDGQAYLVDTNCGR